MPTTSIRFGEEVKPSTHAVFEAYSEVTGKIKNITISFPPGCAGLVKVAVWKGMKQLVPDRGFLNLDNATPVFPFEEPIREGDRIWVDIYNYDALNKHTPQVLVIIEGE